MKATYIYIVLVIVIFGGVLFLAQNSTGSDNDPVSTAAYDEFSACLADAGANFYGAFWCPHCQEQKELLNNSKNIPYVECSTPDSQGQTQVCSDEEIKSYPTWKFSDGSVLTGARQLSDLSEKTNCSIPTT